MPLLRKLPRLSHEPGSDQSIEVELELEGSSLDDRTTAASGGRRITLRDTRQFEIAIDYPLRFDANEARYRIESYFFVPERPGLDRRTYDRARFYRDLRCHLRLESPASVPPPNAPKRNGRPRTPQPISGTIDAVGAASDEQARIRELRLYGCRFEEDVSRRMWRVVDAMRLRRTTGGARGVAVDRGATRAHPVPVPSPEDVARRVDALVTETRADLDRLRAIVPSLDRHEAEGRAPEVVRWVDEYVGLVFEESLTRLESV